MLLTTITLAFSGPATLMLQQTRAFISAVASGSSKDTWSQYCTQAHNDESTLLHRDDDFALTLGSIKRNTLYRNYSPMRFDQHFYYGHFDQHLWLLMFKPPKKGNIRFSHSPSGGGYNKDLQTTNPAWDFQFIIPDYDVMVDYSFSARAVFREKCSREEILKEVQSWNKPAK